MGFWQGDSSAGFMCWRDIAQGHNAEIEEDNYVESHGTCAQCGRYIVSTKYWEGGCYSENAGSYFIILQKAIIVIIWREVQIAPIMALRVLFMESVSVLLAAEVHIFLSAEL